MGDARLRDARSDMVFAAEQGCWTHLDVGCGRGEMLDYGKELGMLGSGVEIVPELVARREDVVCGGAAEIVELFGRNTFDLVTCFDVLEHLPIDEETRAPTGWGYAAPVEALCEKLFTCSSLGIDAR